MMDHEINYLYETRTFVDGRMFWIEWRGYFGGW